MPERERESRPIHNALNSFPATHAEGWGQCDQIGRFVTIWVTIISALVLSPNWVIFRVRGTLFLVNQPTWAYLYVRCDQIGRFGTVLATIESFVPTFGPNLGDFRSHCSYCFGQNWMKQI